MKVLLAALRHLNIASIFALEVNAIVMELVEGHTLRGPLPLSDTIPIARQIAEALDAAHSKGIVRRDLKPGNSKVTPDGLVKVLDFGLANAVIDWPLASSPIWIRSPGMYRSSPPCAANLSCT